MNEQTAESRIRDILPDLEHVYTDIHAHPELSMQETRTAGLAAAGIPSTNSSAAMAMFVDAASDPDCIACFRL